MERPEMPTTLEYLGRTFETVLSYEELDCVTENLKDRNGVPVHIAQKANSIMRQCDCECHTPGVIVRHIGPCCQLVYSKLFTELLKDGLVK